MAKRGRPSKYSDAYCDEVISCLSEGHSVTAFAGRIGVARSTVFKWAEEHPDFSDALRVGQSKATEFWERLLIRVAGEGGGNATAAIFGVKNRAADDWRDKQDVEVTGEIKSIERSIVEPRPKPNGHDTTYPDS